MIRYASLALLCAALAACSDGGQTAGDGSFTVIMIPDTQNEVNFRHQRAEGFVIDSADIFIERMRYIASRARSNGGDVAFVASVGDVWEHASEYEDPDHEARGIEALHEPDSYLDSVINPAGVIDFEIPKSIEGYRIIANAGLPFGVAPGNHDYDAWFATTEANGEKRNHIGGLDNFNSAFGSDSDFFRGKSWYVDSFNGGANSAQVFSAGGYRFLHLALEMQPGDDVILWAAGVIDRYFGLPTIVSTHDYLNARGERMATYGMDLAYIDPAQHNSAEELWRVFISRTDQIFMVLSGHQSGQALRVDRNEDGHEVYQILADFQYRAQAGWEAGMTLNENGQAPGIGDGWLREMTFSLGGAVPRVDVRTYSSHFDKYSSELDRYAAWYRDIEQPSMTDSQFYAADEYTIELRDFRERFGSPAGM